MGFQEYTLLTVGFQDCTFLAALCLARDPTYVGTINNGHTVHTYNILSQLYTVSQDLLKMMLPSSKVNHGHTPNIEGTGPCCKVLYYKTSSCLDPLLTTTKALKAKKGEARQP